MQHFNKPTPFISIRSSRRAMLALLTMGSLFTLAGCGSSSESSCDSGTTRTFICGSDRAGLQPQTCVDGIWETTSFCALPDGTEHPDAPPFKPGNNGGTNNDNNTNNGGTNNDNNTNNIDDPGVTRPTNPDGCIILKNDDVNGGKTLTSDNCYVIESDLTVQEGTLRIEPGTSILLRKDVRFNIRAEGRLHAVGEPGKMIWFHGSNAEKGFWAGISIEDTGSGDNVLDYVSVQHAGSRAFTGNSASRGGVFVNSPNVKLTISNSTFENNAFSAINLMNGNSTVSIQSSTFKSNDIPLRLRAGHFRLLGDDLSFSDHQDDNGDDSNYILMAGGSEEISKNGTWPAYTYRCEAGIEITGAITIAPGATFQMMKNARFTITGDDASMKAIGTADEPITFTGVAKRSGSWTGLVFTNTNSPDNTLEHVVIENAGDRAFTGNNTHRGGLFIYGADVQLSVQNTTFIGNQSSGMMINSDQSKVAAEQLVFIKNEVPLITTANHIGNFQDLEFEDNDTQAIQVTGGNVSRNATWSAFAVPYEVQNIVNVSAHLTLSPKSTLQFHPNTGLNIEGASAALIAKTEDSDRIVMEGITDVRGAWRGVYFQSKNNINELNGVDIINPGSNQWHGGERSKAGIFVGGDARAIVNNTTVQGSGGYGISVDGTARMIGCSGLTVNDNALGNFLGIVGVSECE